MEPRISLLTLGVDDVARARAFYEKLGFVASSASTNEVAFFPAGGTVLAVFSRAALAKDSGVTDAGKAAFSGVALAHNVRTDEEVGAVLAAAEGAGGIVVKPAERAFWGGMSGYFSDQDGHLWEVACNPFFPLDADGRVTLP
ncbi:VOC family protein [Hyphomicrobium sp.]|uniref:VOC family protein n=1 Tax=Hyphomicrobium sp. TaxID=82 RepID=UPI002D023F37|nr:VOC family protein [Hyphomicrobium sp.]HRN88462.1 VOC family protein [Hyphomicrobium sp.]HRQ25577.1 VOC family protein [Hyphomicrobium sp.]